MLDVSAKNMEESPKERMWAAMGMGLSLKATPSEILSRDWEIRAVSVGLPEGATQSAIEEAEQWWSGCCPPLYSTWDSDDDDTILKEWREALGYKPAQKLGWRQLFHYAAKLYTLASLPENESEETTYRRHLLEMGVFLAEPTISEAIASAQANPSGEPGPAEKLLLSGIWDAVSIGLLSSASQTEIAAESERKAKIFQEFGVDPAAPWGVFGEVTEQQRKKRLLEYFRRKEVHEHVLMHLGLLEYHPV